MLTNMIKVEKSYFLVLPLVVFLMAPSIHDVHGVTRLVGLVVGTYLMFLINPKGIVFTNTIQFFLWAIVGVYIVIQLILKNDFQQFLLGNYMRNGGLIALICFALIFNFVSNYKLPISNLFCKSIIFTLFGLTIFGLLEKLSLLPFEIISKYEGALSLTLVNPNFASSYLAIAISVSLIYILLIPYRYKYVTVIILLLAIYIFTQTNSLQGYLLVIINFILLIIYKRVLVITLFNKVKVFSLILIGMILIFITVNISQLFSWIQNNGSVTQRLNYWRLVLDIWVDNKLIGVGLENLRDYAPRYRSEALLKQEGIFTNPDRAHNVFLDHLVQGGLLAGIIWFLFILIISTLAARNLLSKTKNLTPTDFIVIMVWFSYVAQSAISVDHLALTLLGVISGAIIARNNLNKWITIRPRKETRSIIFALSTIVTALVLSCLIFLGQVIRFEYWALDVVSRKNSTYLQKIYESKIVVPQTIEDIAVEISKAKNFDLAYTFGEKLLKHRPSSHQGYYIRSVYFESKLDLNSAKTAMLKALELDPYNSVYLASMSIYEYKLNNLSEAKKYYGMAKDINPNQEGLDLISEYITD
jgi:O-antigen ligase